MSAIVSLVNGKKLLFSFRTTGSLTHWNLPCIPFFALTSLMLKPVSTGQSIFSWACLRCESWPLIPRILLPLPLACSSTSEPLLGSLLPALYILSSGPFCVWFFLSMLSLLSLSISTDTHLYSWSCPELQASVPYKHMSKMEIGSFPQIVNLYVQFPILWHHCQ